MRWMSIREMRASLGRLDELAREAGEIVVTRRGKPVARVLPMVQRREMPSHADLRASMPRLSVPSELLVREDRDER